MAHKTVNLAELREACEALMSDGNVTASLTLGDAGCGFDFKLVCQNIRAEHGLSVSGERMAA